MVVKPAFGFSSVFVRCHIQMRHSTTHTRRPWITSQELRSLAPPAY